MEKFHTEKDEEDKIVLRNTDTKEVFHTDPDDIDLLSLKTEWSESELISYNAAEDTNVPKSLRYRAKRFDGLSKEEDFLLACLFKLHVAESDSIVSKTLIEKLGMGKTIDFIVKDDMICPVSKQHCDDECCTIGSICNASSKHITNEK